MLRVQFNVQHLSSYIRTAVELLISNSSKLTELMLPKILADINRISNESVTYTRTTVDKLSYLPDLLSENSEDRDRDVIFNQESYETDRLFVKNTPKEYRILQTALPINRILTEKAIFLSTPEYTSKLFEVNQTILNATPTAAGTTKHTLPRKRNTLK
ncbi:unnamed protein product [Rotaria sp. Silwood2]|nr:unnamed protein product [Rotaria sp. Silwood2]